MSKKRRPATAVKLCTPEDWKALPQNVRIALLRGRDRVGKIRSLIAAASPCRYMPPVDIVAAIWCSPDCKNHINGRATLLNRDGEVICGVELDAMVAVSDDNGIVRAVLAHEFTHCFAILTRAVNHVDSGAHGELSLESATDAFTDDRFEEDSLTNPSHWLGPEDSRILHWGDPRLSNIERKALELGLHNYLPVVTPPMKFEADRLSIPEAVIRRIRSLRGGSRGRRTG